MNRRQFKVTPSLRKKINTLAKKIGCPLNWRRKPGIQWDTKDVACKGQDASNIIHDIAHYAIATKKARKCLDYGLGAGPESSSDDKIIIIEELYNDIVCGKIEEKASALGIFWEKELGLPWKKTAEYHSWNRVFNRITNDEFGDLKVYWKKLSKFTKGKNISYE